MKTRLPIKIYFALSVINMLVLIAGVINVFANIVDSNVYVIAISFLTFFLLLGTPILRVSFFQTNNKEDAMFMRILLVNAIASVPAVALLLFMVFFDV